MTPTPRVTAPLFARLVGMSMLLALAAGPAAAADLSAEVKAELATTPFVYIQSERKTGAWGTPAEIWFFWDQGAVWVGTKPASWRVKRIGWGRKKARIAVGKQSGTTFEAEGAVVKDPAMQAKLLETYAKKYGDTGWKKWEASFRDGFKDGSRVLVRYTPK